MNWQQSWSAAHSRYCCYLREIGCKTKVPDFHPDSTKKCNRKVCQRMGQKKEASSLEFLKRSSKLIQNYGKIQALSCFKYEIVLKSWCRWSIGHLEHIGALTDSTPDLDWVAIFLLKRQNLRDLQPVRGSLTSRDSTRIET